MLEAIRTVGVWNGNNAHTSGGQAAGEIFQDAQGRSDELQHGKHQNDVVDLIAPESLRVRL